MRAYLCMYIHRYYCTQSRSRGMCVCISEHPQVYPFVISATTDGSKNVITRPHLPIMWSSRPLNEILCNLVKREWSLH